ncbi:thioredoxin-domain-containing protein [Byssothecium circinans]|uniref:Thioredoxin-domain-containing protein n=1 Tax=Byssothecium circinans TaxID=147558 RepID=A0A6A5TGA7_9PLEO|nr:thioredoxin-domain-containing protein [Byssothecium circinans]
MFARTATSALLNRTLLTYTRTATSTATSTCARQATFTNLYRPLFTPKFFSNTAQMSDKEGVHNLTSKAEFDKALEDKDTLLVLDCFATWCGPCKVIAPQVVKLSDKYPTARFYKIDVDEVTTVASELGIRAMPTFILFKNGDKVAEVVGANPKALETAIKDNLPKGEAAA